MLEFGYAHLRDSRRPHEHALVTSAAAQPVQAVPAGFLHGDAQRLKRATKRGQRAGPRAAQQHRPPNRFRTLFDQGTHGVHAVDLIVFAAHEFSAPPCLLPPSDRTVVGLKRLLVQCPPSRLPPQGKPGSRPRSAWIRCPALPVHVSGYFTGTKSILRSRTLTDVNCTRNRSARR